MTSVFSRLFLSIIVISFVLLFAFKSIDLQNKTHSNDVQSDTNGLSVMGGLSEIEAKANNAANAVAPIAADNSEGLAQKNTHSTVGLNSKNLNNKPSSSKNSYSQLDSQFQSQNENNSSDPAHFNEQNPTENTQSQQEVLEQNNLQPQSLNEITDSIPQLTLIGEQKVNAYLGQPYVDLGATAFDAQDGVLKVTTSGVVDTQVLGEYELVYSTVDSSNHIVKKTRTVTVLPNLFITIWKTNNEGKSQDNQITLETNNAYQYNFSVDWGDGEIDTQVNANITHTYAQPGEYQIIIGGQYPSHYYSSSNDSSDAKKLLSVENWGDNRWQTMQRAFYGCQNMVINAADAPDLSLVENMNKMFGSAHKFNQYIGHWDVSNVKNMSQMFFIASSFNQDISNWDVSNVVDMSDLFRFAGDFNQDISRWNVAKVKTMNGMFMQADHFNQDIGSWDISSVERLDYMFAGTDRFNQNLNSWDLTSVNNVSGMFSGAKQFNQDLNQWDVTNVKNMSSMFQSTQSFNGNISDWQLDKATSLSNMFKGAQAFNGDISRWNVSGVSQMKNMFKDAVNFNQDLSLWNISNVTDMTLMFENLTLTTEQYDKLLQSWANQIPQQNVVFDAGNSQFTKDSLAHTARNTLVDVFGWTITDGSAK